MSACSLNAPKLDYKCVKQVAIVKLTFYNGQPVEESGPKNLFRMPSMKTIAYWRKLLSENEDRFIKLPIDIKQFIQE